MIREPTVPSEEIPADDHSMRLVEYSLAVLAIVASVILALIR